MRINHTITTANFRQFRGASSRLDVHPLLGVALVPTLYLAGVVPAIFHFFRPSVVANFGRQKPKEVVWRCALGERSDQRWGVGAANFAIIASLQLDPLNAGLPAYYQLLRGKAQCSRTGASLPRAAASAELRVRGVKSSESCIYEGRSPTTMTTPSTPTAPRPHPSPPINSSFQTSRRKPSGRSLVQRCCWAIVRAAVR